MTSKKLILIITVIGLIVSGAMAQKKHVVIHKEMLHGDSTEFEFTFDHDFNIEILDDSTHQYWLQKGITRLDSLDKELIFADGKYLEFLNDSALKKMVVHSIPHFQPKPARIIIKKSGFFRKSKIIIDFDPLTQRILQVIDNDEKVPENKFHKYQDHLEGATEYADYESLHPRMEEIEMKIDMLQLPDSEKLADLEALIIDLENFDSHRAHLKKQHYVSAKRIIELDKLAEGLQNILSDAGITPPQKITSIAIKDGGKFFLNEDEIKGDVGEKCIQFYIENTDMTTEDFQKKGEEISIQITFD